MIFLKINPRIFNCHISGYFHGLIGKCADIRKRIFFILGKDPLSVQRQVISVSLNGLIRADCCSAIRPIYCFISTQGQCAVSIGTAVQSCTPRRHREHGDNQACQTMQQNGTVTIGQNFQSGSGLFHIQSLLTTDILWIFWQRLVYFLLISNSKKPAFIQSGLFIQGWITLFSKRKRLSRRRLPRYRPSSLFVRQRRPPKPVRRYRLCFPLTPPKRSRHRNRT